MLLFRYSNTGVVECIRKAVECLNVIPVFPVKNVNHFSSGRLFVFKYLLIIFLFYYYIILLTNINSYIKKKKKKLNYNNSGTKTVFSDCLLVPGGTTVREFAIIIHPELDKYYQYTELLDILEY